LLDQVDSGRALPSFVVIWQRGFRLSLSNRDHAADPIVRCGGCKVTSTEFPDPGPGAGINSQIAISRAQPVVLRNNRFLIGVTMMGGIFAAIMAVAMVLGMFSKLFPLSALTAARGWSALRWALSALAMGSMCPWLWNLGRSMAGYDVRLDGRGVEFNLGTKKAPANLFIAWDQVAAIKHKRVGNVQQYWVHGADGSEARFSSYTFFRPKKVARLIAARAGLTIQEA
jgi:hypothetical protein